MKNNSKSRRRTFFSNSAFWWRTNDFEIRCWCSVFKNLRSWRKAAKAVNYDRLMFICFSWKKRRKKSSMTRFSFKIFCLSVSLKQQQQKKLSEDNFHVLQHQHLLPFLVMTFELKWKRVPLTVVDPSWQKNSAVELMMRSPKLKFKEVDSFLWKQEKSEQARVSFLLKQNHEQLKEITKNVTLRF